MAARYAKITLRAGWSWNDSIRAVQTEFVRLRLGGQQETYRRGGGANEYAVPDPDDTSPQREFVLQGVRNLAALIKATIVKRGLFYTVSDVRDVGDDASHGGFDNGDNTPWPLFEFDITATIYDPGHDIAFAYSDAYQGWKVVANLTTIRPLNIQVITQDAGIFGTATGSANLQASGNGAPYDFRWADGFVGDQRPGMAKGTYYCTVTDALGESARVEIVIDSDPRLQVAVVAGPDSVELVPSGGLPPYAVAWADGPTTFRRTGLAEGTYPWVVTDARGARLSGQVVIERADRYWFSGNPITLSLQASDPTATGFACEVFVEPDYLSGVFVPAGLPLEQPLDADGRTTFEVQELLEPFVAPVLPAPGATAIGLQNGQFCRFYLQHYEVTPTSTGASTSVQTNYLLHGGLGFEQAISTDWLSYQQRRLPFLTWEPDFKKVLPDQPEYLYFMAPRAVPAGFALRLDLTWADGTTTSQATLTGPAALVNEVFCLPVGPLALGLAALEAAAGQLLTRYAVTVQARDGGAALSETRTFVPDRRPCAVRRYFLYANSLGGWNTLVCRGRGSRELATKTSLSENALAAGYDPLRGSLTINRRTGTPTLKCYTGARSAAQLLADQDFLLSERVLLLQDGRYLAGQVKDRTVGVADDDETRRVVQFDYELPRERYYTPRLPTA
jgi:hypothetical protein